MLTRIYISEAVRHTRLKTHIYGFTQPGNTNRVRHHRLSRTDRETDRQPPPTPPYTHTHTHTHTQRLIKGEMWSS